MPATKLTVQGNGRQQGWNPHPAKQEEVGIAEWGWWITLASTCYLIHIIRGLYR